MIAIHGEYGTIEDNYFHNRDDQEIHLYPPDGGRLVIIGCEISSDGIERMYDDAVFEGRFELKK